MITTRPRGPHGRGLLSSQRRRPMWTINNLSNKLSNNHPGQHRIWADIHGQQTRPELHECAAQRPAQVASGRRGPTATAGLVFKIARRPRPYIASCSLAAEQVLAARGVTSPSASTSCCDAGSPTRRHRWARLVATRDCRMLPRVHDVRGTCKERSDRIGEVLHRHEADPLEGYTHPRSVARADMGANDRNEVDAPSGADVLSSTGHCMCRASEEVSLHATLDAELAVYWHRAADQQRSQVSMAQLAPTVALILAIPLVGTASQKGQAFALDATGCLLMGGALLCILATIALDNLREPDIDQLFANNADREIYSLRGINVAWRVCFASNAKTIQALRTISLIGILLAVSACCNAAVFLLASHAVQ